jgi:hypothetical protein
LKTKLSNPDIMSEVLLFLENVIETNHIDEDKKIFKNIDIAAEIPSVHNITEEEF